MSQYPPPGNFGEYPPPPPPGGYPPPGGQPPQQYWQESPKGKGLAVTALVLGIIAVVTFWTVILTVVGVFFGLLAAIFGLIAMMKARRGTSGGFGMAVAGLILGLLGLIGGIVVGILVWVVFKDNGGTDLVDCLNKAGNDKAAQQQCQNDFQQRIEDKFSVTPTPVPTR
ncbi:DUF4190 domain-containing protein [Nocardia sp. SYP-A9097]|uniref:DUF4190 domain-containing protein n=1 Tax=Nocardia sp. SYP-A9097 TaxID=2663237 RepID=UPI00129BEB35|nr:DUF4190 domain-containing protein [Nocardia sp. SYP-A9097]MRH86329.1 DUF4190 domain-containing protein [Nocardia sp. SYP-A9097]